MDGTRDRFWPLGPTALTTGECLGIAFAALRGVGLEAGGEVGLARAGGLGEQIAVDRGVDQAAVRVALVIEHVAEQLGVVGDVRVFGEEPGLGGGDKGGRLGLLVRAERSGRAAWETSRAAASSLGRWSESRGKWSSGRFDARKVRYSNGLSRHISSGGKTPGEPLNGHGSIRA
jgi:hypothetical protein